jgi:spore coat polysaccharide biosynthesis protein SpsF
MFTEEWLQNRTELRLTLDEPADYELLRRVYAEIPYDDLLEVRDAIHHLDQSGLGGLNAHVEQKEI